LASADKRPANGRGAAHPTEKNVTCSAKKSFLVLAVLMALLLALSAGAQPATTRPARAVRSRQAAAPKPTTEPAAPGKPEPTPNQTGAGKWEAAGVTKREWKTQKRERQQAAMLERIKRRAEGGPPLRAAPTSRPSEVVCNPYQLAEDFDREAKWEQRENRAVHPGTDYGYSHENHLASAGCAPGEIGGTVSDHGISWFADDVGGQTRLLDVETPLTATGWCTFTATDGRASLGWFNSTTYAAPHTAPDAFLGWRQEGATLRAALGHTGTSFVDGPPVAISSGKPLQWSLNYTPTGGEDRCGQLTLNIGGSSSALSLTPEQRNALSQKHFNRFGIVTGQTGNPASSTLWLDNLVYTRISGFPVPNAKATAHTRTAFFDTDSTGSTFHGVNNLSPHEPVTVTQDYGYRPAGGRTGGGCVGGRSSQAIGTSYYGYDYGDRMLHFTDKLRSEGWFQVPDYEGSSIRLGWTSKVAKSWHEPSTLALRVSSIHIKGEGRRINVSAEGTLGNYEGHGGAGWGTIVTFAAGPEWHHYVMEFDPEGEHGLGTFTVQVDDTSKVFHFGEDKLKHGGDIDLFGLWNSKIPAEAAAFTLYLDDVTNTVNGRPDPSSNSFNTAPAGWVGRNNQFTAKDYVVRPYHEFGWAGALKYLDGRSGYSPMYVLADADRHCMGGIIYLASYENLNVPRAAYGAGLDGTLNARDHHLCATGRFKIDWANVDAAELFGWYNSATACDKSIEGKGHMFPDKFLGVAIHGGSNGYGMIPGYRSPHLAEEQMPRGNEPAARVYEDGQWREFYMEYDPDGAGGNGRLKLQIGRDGKPVVYDLKPGAKGENGDFAFDRFGLLTMRKGGGKPHAIYFDALTYTVAP
jgi:hypothetical protein